MSKCLFSPSNLASWECLDRCNEASTRHKTIMTESSVMRLRGSRDFYWSESRTLLTRMTHTGLGDGHWSSDLRSHAVNLGLVPDHAVSLGDKGPKESTPI
jgi:hypothetical protein